MVYGGVVPARSGAHIVGRDEELSLLENALRGAALGVAHVALVTGEAGIGKTALISALADIADDSGVTVVRASGDEFEADIGFGVVDQLVRLPRPSERDAISAGEHLVDTWSVEDDPVRLVMVDDAQWSDGESLRALTYALRRLPHARLLFVIACRTDTLDALPPGLLRVAAGRTGSTTALGPLETAAFGELLRNAGVQRLTPAAIERIREHTDANPMLALTLVRDVGNEELVGDVTRPLVAPKSTAALVLARVASLSAQAVRLLFAAAVLGASCTLESAADVAEIADARAAADEGDAAGLIRIDARFGEQTLTFVHPTTRSAIYHDLEPEQLTHLHQRAAEVTADPTEELKHRLQGATGPDEPLATLIDGMAENMARAGAWAEAAMWLDAATRVSSTERSRERRALTADAYRLYAGHDPGPDGELDLQRDHPLRLLLAGNRAVQESRFGDAEVILLAAWEMIDPSQDADTAVRVALRLSDTYQGQLRSAQALEWASRAVEVVPAGADVLGEDPLTDLSLALVVNGRLSDAVELIDERVPAGVDARAAVPGMLARGTVRLWSDEIARGVGDLGSCADRYQRVGPPHKCVEAQSLLCEANYRIGHWDFGARHGDEAVTLARDIGIHQLTALALTSSVAIAAGRGHWKLSDAMLTEALDLLALRGSYQVLGLTWLARARLAAAQADPQGVVDALSTIAAVSTTMPEVDEQGVLPWRLPYGAALVALGRLDEAEDQCAQLTKFAGRGVGRAGEPSAARLRGLIAGARGEVDSAAAALTSASAQFTEIPMPFEAAQADYDHGVLLRRAGRRREAAERLEAARAVFARLDAKPFVDRCDAEIASCGLRGSRPSGPVAAGLTTAESAVAQLVGAGKSNREVAADLVISVRTVESHLRNIYSKLGVSSRTQLAARMSAAKDQ